MHLSRDPMTRSPSSVGLPIPRRVPLIAMRASTELTRRLASSSSMPSCPPPKSGVGYRSDLWRPLYFQDNRVLLRAPGYPIVGISFFGTAFSEPTLIRLASGFEAATQAASPPLSRVPRPDRRPF